MGLKTWVFSLWAFCCHMWALHELHNIELHKDHFKDDLKNPFKYDLRNKFKDKSGIFREAPVRFGSVTVWRWNGSSGSGFRFLRFLCKKGFFCISVQFHRKGRFRFRFRLLENGSGGSGSTFGFGKKRFRRFRFPVPVRFLSHPAFFEEFGNISP